MNLLREYVRRTLTEIVGDNCNVLSVFDFDDTLVTTDSMVNVIRADGSLEPVTTDYSVQSGEQLDYSEFDTVKNAQATEYLAKLIQELEKCGTDSVLVLTARAPEAANAMRKFFSSVGIHVVDIVTVGGNNVTSAAAAQAKALQILDYAKRLSTQGLEQIHFYDDSTTNIAAVEKMVLTHPFFAKDQDVTKEPISVKTHLVKIGQGAEGESTDLLIDDG